MAEDVSMGEDREVAITLPGIRNSTVARQKAQNQADLALIGKQGGSFPFPGLDQAGSDQPLKIKR